MLNPSALIDPLYSICVIGDLKVVTQDVVRNKRDRIKGFISYARISNRKSLHVPLELL